MSQVGDITRVPVDPDLHFGADEAAAIVTRVHEDGTFNLRVFSDDPLGADEFRSHVNLDGSQHDYEAAGKPAADQAAADQAAGQQAREAAAAQTPPAFSGADTPTTGQGTQTTPGGDAQPPATQQGAGY